MQGGTEALAAAIRKIDGMDAARWATMLQRHKMEFRVPGTDIGLHALATRFGLEGEPVSSRELHRELGKRIFSAPSKPARHTAQIHREGWLPDLTKERRILHAPGSRIGVGTVERRVPGDQVTAAWDSELEKISNN